jgi:hypothetical protein
MTDQSPTVPPAVDFQARMQQLHDDGVIDLDRPLREFLSPAGLHIDVPEPGGRRSQAVVVWPTIFGSGDSVPVETLTSSLADVRAAVAEMQISLQAVLDSPKH